MQIEFDGKTYTYDPNKIDVLAATAIWSHTGYGLMKWNAAVRDMEPRSVAALFWIVKHQNGEPCVLSELNFEIVPFLDALQQAFIAEDEKAEAAAAEKGDADPNPKDSSEHPTDTPMETSAV